MPRRLRVEYRTSESFRTEYAQNIAKGGIFVPTRHVVELREHVEVELLLSFSDQSIVLPGEVVHCIPPEMAASGAQPGVAIQFLLDGDELRGKLEIFSGPVALHVDEREQQTGRRIAPRVRALVPADVEVDGRWIAAHTRNVSRSGALVEMPGDAPEVGRRVKLRIKLPGGRDQMKVGAQVTRHVMAGRATCVGVQFQVPETHSADVAAFVERVRAVEHSRRLGGINGPIAALGIQSVLAMFGGNTPQGMLTLTRGDDEGYILMENGMLRAQVGVSSGRVALDELLSWTEGNFSFEGRVDETLVVGEEIAVAELGLTGPAPGATRGEAGDDESDELVLMDLEDFMEPPEPAPSPPEPAPDGFVPDGDHSLGEFVLDDDEADALEASLRLDTARIDPDATLVVARDADRADLGKTEEALLDLATAGLTVAKALEIIPEPSDQVYAALQNLLDEGFLTLA